MTDLQHSTSTAENLSDRLMMNKMPPKGLFLCNIIVLPSGKQEGGNMGLFGEYEQSDYFEVKLSANQYRLKVHFQIKCVTLSPQVCLHAI